MVLQAGSSAFGFYDNNGGTGFKSAGFNWNTGENALVKGVYTSNSVQFSKNSLAGTNITGINTTTDRFEVIGNYQAGGQPFGYISEVIVYPTTLTAVQQNTIESYLGTKYGISRDQTTPTDYINTSGITTWSASSAGSYKYNIAGIARDDLSALNQSKSQSINSTTDLIVSATNGLNINLTSLMWSHDNSSTTTLSNTDTMPGMQRIARRWYFQEKNGDTGVNTISYPVAALPSGWTGTPILYTDADGIFATGATGYTGTFNAGANTWDFSINISNNTYTTIGKSVPIDTTPPVIGSISIASGSLLPIGTFPLTTTYSDTGSAINAGSFTGKIYTWTGGTWSVTNIAPGIMNISSSTTSTGVFQITGLPSGKYRFDISVADSVGNIITQSYIYYIDGISWSVSSDQYDIGTPTPEVQSFGTGEMIVTIQTVGAGFSLRLIASNPLVK